jgi:two-component system, cell cycle sensor histidine kinase and response regulator CckA
VIAPTAETNTEKTKILIVEDEGLIARDIASRLERSGYAVVGIAEAGDEALRKVEEFAPDLILMDIRINGDMDGVETATRIQEQFDLPIIYITAHSDRETLDRAKITAPFGFLTKPLHQTNLKDSIEIALYKHQLEREGRRQRASLTAVLRNIGEAVIVTDGDQKVQFMNLMAEQLTGWRIAEAKGRSLLGVLEIFDDRLGHLRAEVLSGLMLEDDQPAPLPHGITAMHRGGHVFLIEGEIAPARDVNEMFGAVLTFRDATTRRKEEHVVRHENKMDAVGRFASNVASDVNKILAAVRCTAEDGLKQATLDGGSRVALESIVRSMDDGDALVQQLMLFGYVWAA